MKQLLLALGLFSTLNAFAVSGVGGCKGSANGDAFEMKATMGDVFDLSTGKAELLVDGRLVARFDGEDMQINVMARTFTITNSHGDTASGKLTSVLKKSGVIYSLKVPAYGINVANMPVKCWSKRN